MAGAKGTDQIRAVVPLVTMDDLQALLALYSGSATHLFIHIPKNAGVSMRKAPQLRWKMVGVHKFFLKDRAYLDELRLAMGAAGQHHGIAHARLRDIKPTIAGKLLPVAVVRNPWARVVSRFRFAQLAASNGSRFEAPPTSSFEAFLESRHEDGDRPFFWHRASRGWFAQRDYVANARGAVAADILRQEHLSEDAMAYFGLSTPIAARNVTSREKSGDWRTLYTRKTIQIIADWYAEDISTFGFDFDGSATRNCWFNKG